MVGKEVAFGLVVASFRPSNADPLQLISVPDHHTQAASHRSFSVVSVNPPSHFHQGSFPDSEYR